jgi:release factor glutamine methyltransferase
MKMRETVTTLMMEARKALVAADIDGSALDVRLLMQAITGLSHEELVVSPDFAATEEVVEEFAALVKRRLAFEPVSRILGRREFYGREFQVTSAVLDPRADTEALIELVLELTSESTGKLLDVGTGSGAIAVTLLAELSGFTGLAIDVSVDALHVAKKNALANGVSGRLQFHHGSWFDGVTEKFNLIISNPPYIPHNFIAELGLEVRDYDPHLALDGGVDGLYGYRAIAAGALTRLEVNGSIAVEIGAGQEADVTSIFASHGFQFAGRRKDLGGHVRALGFRR